MKITIKNPLVRYILQALAVAGFGFILLNLTFIFDYLFQSSISRLINLFTQSEAAGVSNWFPFPMHVLFMIVIGLISWAIFRTKLGVTCKAIYLTVPVAVVLVTVGILLYRWPVISYSVGSLLVLATLYYFYRTRQPWIYYYTVILVGLTLLIFTLSGGEI